MPHAEQTVFLLTEKKTVYRSKDEGTTWAEQTPALNAAVESDPTLKKDLLSRVLLGVKTVLPSPADPERVRGRMMRTRVAGICGC